MSGVSETELNEMLNLLCRGGWYGQMHLADPGVGGLLNPSVDDDRTQVLFSAADGGLITMTGLSEWASTTSQEIEWISFWSGMDPGTSTWKANGKLQKKVTLANGDYFQLSSVVVEFVLGKVS